jgi:hypothetical protein
MDKLAFATSVGIVCGLGIFLASLWLVIKGGPVVGPNLQLLGQYIIGYTVTVQGSFLGFSYSFLWGFIFGWLFAYLRNFLLGLYIYLVKKEVQKSSLRHILDYI